jgi:tRNA-2-methylthio-N6-dimethylallyladenosine synthase
MATQVPPEVSLERLHRLQALITGQWQAFNASFVGRTVEVLLEKPGRLPGQLVGKTPYLQTVQVMARPELIGQLVSVAITGTGTNTLFGDIISSSPPPGGGRSIAKRSGGGDRRELHPADTAGA